MGKREREREREREGAGCFSLFVFMMLFDSYCSATSSWCRGSVCNVGLVCPDHTRLLLGLPLLIRYTRGMVLSSELFKPEP